MTRARLLPPPPAPLPFSIAAEEALLAIALPDTAFSIAADTVIPPGALSPALLEERPWGSVDGCFGATGRSVDGGFGQAFAFDQKTSTEHAIAPEDLHRAERYLQGE